MTMGEHMIEARKARGLTQAELAAISGVDRVTIRAIEKGYRERGPRLDTVIQLADALGIGLDEYVGREVPGR